MRLLLDSKNGVLSSNRLYTNFQLRFPVILQDSAAFHQVVSEFNLPKIIRDSRFEAVEDVMAWKTRWHWTEMSWTSRTLHSMSILMRD